MPDLASRQDAPIASSGSGDFRSTSSLSPNQRLANPVIYRLCGVQPQSSRTLIHNPTAVRLSVRGPIEVPSPQSTPPFSLSRQERHPTEPPLRKTCVAPCVVYHEAQILAVTSTDILLTQRLSLHCDTACKSPALGPAFSVHSRLPAQIFDDIQPLPKLASTNESQVGAAVTATTGTPNNRYGSGSWWPAACSGDGIGPDAKRQGWAEVDTGGRSPHCRTQNERDEVGRDLEAFSGPHLPRLPTPLPELRKKAQRLLDRRLGKQVVRGPRTVKATPSPCAGTRALTDPVQVRS